MDLKLVLLAVAVEQEGFLRKQHGFNSVTQEVFDVAQSHFEFINFKNFLTGTSVARPIAVSLGRSCAGPSFSYLQSEARYSDW